MVTVMICVDLNHFILTNSAAAWRDLIEQDRERGGSGELNDTAISLTRGRTMITLYCDYSDDSRMLSAGFMLPEPLPAAREPFLLDLHEWLEGKVAEPPKLPRVNDEHAMPEFIGV